MLPDWTLARYFSFNHCVNVFSIQSALVRMRLQVILLCFESNLLLISYFTAIATKSLKLIIFVLCTDREIKLRQFRYKFRIFLKRSRFHFIAMQRIFLPATHFSHLPFFFPHSGIKGWSTVSKQKLLDQLQNTARPTMPNVCQTRLGRQQSICSFRRRAVFYDILSKPMEGIDDSKSHNKQSADVYI